MAFAQLVHSAKKSIFTLIGLFIALYFFVILISHSTNDPSWSHISSDMTTVTNMGGIAGAWVSNILLTFLGYSVWWIVIIICYEVALLWWGRSIKPPLSRLTAYFFLILSSSALLSQLSVTSSFAVLGATDIANTGFDRMLVSGGIVGYELATCMTMLLTHIGSVLFFTIFLGFTLTAAFNVYWRELVQFIFAFEWLGSGLKNNTQKTAIATDEVFDDIDEVFDDLDDDLDVVMYETEDDSSDEILFKKSQQLPLDYEKESEPTAQTRTGSLNNQRNPNVLNNFLKGIGFAAASEFDKDKDALASSDNLTDDILLNDTLITEASINESVDNKQFNQNFSSQSESIKTDNYHPDIESSTITSSLVIDSNNVTQANNTAAAVVEPSQPMSSLTTSTPSSESVVEPFDSSNSLEIPQDQDNILSKEVDSPQEMLRTNEPVINPSYATQMSIPTSQSSGSFIPSTSGITEKSDVTMPDVHDDSAFLGQSRAMKTAAFREGLPTLPELSLLERPDPNLKPSYTELELHQLSDLLTIKLQDFNVKAEVVNAIPGPVVTRFEVELAPGIKASKVVGISRDLARSMSMASLRVVEVIPGKPYIGIEVPNKQRQMVRLIELLESDKYRDPKGMISMAMGKDIGGKTVITDLAKAPHMLVAGTTGSGKSVLVNSMLLSMLLKYTPEQLRLILIDPKQLELANYNDIPHLLTPVVTDMTEAAGALSWCVAEMERRYQLMSLLRVRKLDEFNKKVKNAEASGNPIIDPLWRPESSVSMDKAPKLKTLPMIVIVADEFADMIMQVGKQAEELITRLAQKSRAAGIHLILATQRPSVDVITGLIKANIPARAALRVNSKIDSRTILDQGGAEDMLGNGDMLFLGPGQIEPDRVHGAFVSDEEVNDVCEAWRQRGGTDYITNLSENFQLTQDSGSGATGGGTTGEDDALYNDAVSFVMESRKVSASSIQRQFSIGYNRAARIVDSMEQAGIVSAMDKGGKRQLLV